MTNQNRIHLIAIVVIVLLMVAKGIAEHEPAVPLMTEEEKTAAFEEAYQYYNKLGPWDVEKRQLAYDYQAAQKMFPDASLVPFEEYIDTEEFANLLCLDNPSSCTTTALSFGMGFGLTIQVPTPCVDTHLLEDVSCDDKAAIVQYRKALNAIEVDRLQEELRIIDQENLYSKFGLTEA